MEEKTKEINLEAIKNFLESYSDGFLCTENTPLVISSTIEYFLEEFLKAIDKDTKEITVDDIVHAIQNVAEYRFLSPIISEISDK